MSKISIRSNAARGDYFTYAGVVIAFVVIRLLQMGGMVNNSMTGLLVPICCYIVMAISLNLTVGILGELSLGHAGFMSVGAFSGIVASLSLADAIPNAALRLAVAMVVGALCAAVVGALVGLPVLRLHGDYLAIVTLAFGEIIKEVITAVYVGQDSKGLHFGFNFRGNITGINDLHMEEGAKAILKGAQGVTNNTKIATFTAGFILILIALFVVLNLVRSRAGRAIMAIRDNRIAAESVGINVTKYKMMAFVLSASLAGAAGALYGGNYASLQASKFSFDTSILVLVYVVLGGLGNIKGSIVATILLIVLPEKLRALDNYRMLAYAVVLILVMLLTNNAKVRELFGRLVPKKKGESVHER